MNSKCYSLKLAVFRSNIDFTHSVHGFLRHDSCPMQVHLDKRHHDKGRGTARDRGGRSSQNAFPELDIDESFGLPRFAKFLVYVRMIYFGA